jgi:protocatechuate 3,4-dioxygenase beta subunit
MKTPAAQSSEFWGARASSPAVFGVPPNTFPIKPRLHYFLNGSSPDISHFRIRSADFQSAFSVIVAAKPTASRRSGLMAFRAKCEISGSSPKCFMRQLQVGLLILAVALAAPAHAADSAPPTYYTGTVVDDQGRPVAGATVDAYVYQPGEGYFFFERDREPELTQRTVTGANGAFALLPSPGATLAVVKKPGLATTWKTWSSLFENSDDPVVLTTPTPLAGIVLDESNHPAAGAEVWVADAMIGNEYGQEEQENQLFGKPARECFSTKTEADGRFRIPNFPGRGGAGLAVTIKGKAQRPLDKVSTGMTYPYRSGDTDIQLRVAPAGAVEGKVAVENTGQPLAGVKIKLEPSKSGLYGSEYRETIESGEDGSFHIPDVQPGVYDVRAFLRGQPVPDWVLSGAKPENNQVTVVAGETARGLEVQASKGALVQVWVVMTNDLTPVMGALVSAGGSTAYTGINGMVLFRLPAGMAYFSARKDWFSQHREAGIEASQSTNVWIQLLPPPTITGIVRDPSGAPAAGALVSFHPGFYPDMPDYSEVTTGKNGRYEIILKLSREDMGWEGPVYMTNFLLARSLERNLTAIREFVDVPAKLDLDLQPGVTISGSVKDTAGAPVTNATVDLALETIRSSRQTGPPLIKVNAQGAFSLAAMPQGRNYTSYHGVTAKGYGTDDCRLKAEDTKTNHYEFPTFVLKRPDHKLAGQVFGLDGKPFAGANVRFSGEGQLDRWPPPDAKTDSQGHFAFDKVCEGRVTVSANSGYIQGDVPAQGGDTNIVIRLGVSLETFGQSPSPLRIITGTVRDPSGAPSPAVAISLFPVQGSAIDSESGSAGHYEFNWQANPALRETNWLLARDLKRGLVALHQVDKSTTNLDLTLQEGLTISTTVQDITGQPITNATAKVTIWADPRRGYLLNPQPMSRNDRGQFLLNALPRGLRYYLHIESPGYSFANLQAEADDTRTNLLEMPPTLLALTNLALAGRVLSVLGAPASSVQVELMDRFRGSLSDTLADEDGHFTFEGLGPGPLIVTVGRINRSPDPVWVGGSANVMAGDTNVVVQLRLFTNAAASVPRVPLTTSGTVFDPSGAPAPGVLLSSSLLPGSKTPAQSDTTGKYTFQPKALSPFERGQNMKALLFATDPKRNWIAAAELDDATTKLDLHLTPALTLSGAVRDTAGNPVTNANVLLTLYPADAAPTWTRPPATNSDAQGRFSFTTLPPGWHCELRAYAAGYGCNTISLPAAATQTNQLQSPPIVLKPANRQLAGQVIGLDGKPCWGAQVSFTGEGQPTYLTARADSTGYFLFKAVCEGPVQLQAELSVDAVPMFAGETRANGGDTNIVIKLSATNGVPAAPPVRGGQSY